VDGVTLHETIRDLCPGLPVVICTGEATAEQASRMLELPSFNARIEIW
jgi:DNA-binding NtrC family response regulator